MFCSKCGAEIPGDVNRCPSCGAPLSAAAKMGDAVNNAADKAKNAFDQTSQSLDSAIEDVRHDFSGQGSAAPSAGGPLKTDRSLVVYILLSLITCGIYRYYFLYTMARDVNTVCSGDGQETAGLLTFLLLSICTCGFYAYYWYYKLGNRLCANAPRYQLTFQENGTTVLMWCIVGLLICGLGPLFAMHILIKNTNAICAAYNRVNGL